MFKFKSQACAPIIYFEADAKRLLGIIGKDASPQGIITVAQIPSAIAALEAAVEAEAAQEKEQGNPEPQAAAKGQEEGEGQPAAKAVSLRQRAQPLLQMLRESQAAGKDVVWGV